MDAYELISLDDETPDVVELDETILVRTGDGYAIGSGLKLEHGVLMVDAAEAVEADNTKPITSAAVYTEVGNINALLATI